MKSLNSLGQCFALNLIPIRYAVCSLVFSCLLLNLSLSYAGGGPENVFLIVNSASQDSLTVANHYIDLRRIPPCNVFYVRYSGNLAWVQSEKFRETILRPAFKEIADRQLSNQIDYIVYSSDFPYRVRLERDFPDLKLPVSFKPVASLTGATYLSEFIEGKRKEIFSPITNLYAAYDPKSPVTISRAFRADYYWTMGGRRVAKGRGLKYMLSAMLGVTNGRGNSTKEIANYLRRAKEADGSKPKGTVHFIKNNSPRSTPRHGQFPAAARELRLAGVKTETHEGIFVQYKQNIIGITCGHHQLNVLQSKCRFSPGALCDNFTSAGAQFEKPKKPPGQTCVSEFLRLGAAGACGTVIEPTALAQKFPRPSMHVHYARGCSLAESFYQSVLCPYQQLLVGDPLCQPWADSLSLSVAGVRKGDHIRGSISITPEAKEQPLKKIQEYELYVDGVFLAQCKPGEELSLDTTTHDDGYHELSIVGIDNTPIETQSRWTAGVTIKNGRDAVQLSVDSSSVRPAAKQVTVVVASTLSVPIVVTHNGREVGRQPKGNGKVSIDASKLGRGPVTLYAHTSGEVGVGSSPVRLVIP